jgi:hypothetical protein
MLQKEFQSLCNFFFLKIVKIEPANKVQSFFPERDAFNACKTSLFVSFTSLIGMEYLKKFFVLPALPSNEKNSSNHHNSYNKGPNLTFFSFTESPSNSLSTIKFSKIHITSSSYNNMPKTTMTEFQSLLGIRG